MGALGDHSGENVERPKITPDIVGASDDIASLNRLGFFIGIVTTWETGINRWADRPLVRLNCPFSGHPVSTDVVPVGEALCRVGLLHGMITNVLARSHWGHSRAAIPGTRRLKFRCVPAFKNTAVLEILFHSVALPVKFVALLLLSRFPLK